jgi:transposase
LRGRRKGGTERNALGRSRGGFSIKINARTNAEGLPIGIVITPGQAHDVTAFPALMHEIDHDPEQMLGDKGYDSAAVRQEIEKRGGETVIPITASRKIQQVVDKAIYALRNRSGRPTAVRASPAELATPVRWTARISIAAAANNAPSGQSTAISPASDRAPNAATRREPTATASSSREPTATASGGQPAPPPPPAAGKKCTVENGKQVCRQRSK